MMMSSDGRGKGWLLLAACVMMVLASSASCAPFLLACDTTASPAEITACNTVVGSDVLRCGSSPVSPSCETTTFIHPQLGPRTKGCSNVVVGCGEEFFHAVSCREEPVSFATFTLSSSSSASSKCSMYPMKMSLRTQESSDDEWLQVELRKTKKVDDHKVCDDLEGEEYDECMDTSTDFLVVILIILGVVVFIGGMVIFMACRRTKKKEKEADALRDENKQKRKAEYLLDYNAFRTANIPLLSYPENQSVDPKVASVLVRALEDYNGTNSADDLKSGDDVILNPTAEGSFVGNYLVVKARGCVMILEHPEDEDANKADPLTVSRLSTASNGNSLKYLRCLVPQNQTHGRSTDDLIPGWGPNGFGSVECLSTGKYDERTEELPHGISLIIHALFILHTLRNLPWNLSNEGDLRYNGISEEDIAKVNLYLMLFGTTYFYSGQSDASGNYVTSKGFRIDFPFASPIYEAYANTASVEEVDVEISEVATIDSDSGAESETS